MRAKEVGKKTLEILSAISDVLSSFYLGTPNKKIHELPEMMKHFTKQNLGRPNFLW